MQTVQKRTRRAPRHGRLLLLLAAAILLAALLLASRRLNQPPQEDTSAAAPAASLTLCEYAPEDVVTMTITRRNEQPWTVQQNADGLFVLMGENGFTLSEATTAELMDAASILICEQVLSDDPAEYAHHLSDYGLDDPRLIAEIVYADGQRITLRIGNVAAHTSAWYYMMIDGDDRLFAFSRGMTEALSISRDSLRDVTQPTIHKARIDRITLKSSDGAIHAQWTLEGAITNSDALDRWHITHPYAYPADATAISNLLSNAANLRLGAYVGPATTENLTACGFDTPRLTIELHMAAGTIGNTNLDGALVTQEYPESTCTFIIGGEQSDMIDYVLHEDSIYLSSHFTMGVFMDIDLRATMSRYPLLTALGNLDSLTITSGDMTDTYQIIRTEQVAENNDLVYNADGSIVYDTSCTKNGNPFDYAAFEAAYSQLMMVSVSGLLPENHALTADPHTIYTFTDVSGAVHTVALSAFDAMHDAVTVDGHSAFYLIKDGFRLDLNSP